MGRRSSTGRGAVAVAAGAASGPETDVWKFLSVSFLYLWNCSQRLQVGEPRGALRIVRDRGRCALLGRASSAPPSLRSLAGPPPSLGQLSSAWAAGRSGVSVISWQLRRQRPLRQRRLWRWRRGRSWWGNGSCAWRSAKRRSRSAGRADAAAGAGERGLSERCHIGTAAIPTWR